MFCYNCKIYPWASSISIPLYIKLASQEFNKATCAANNNLLSARVSCNWLNWCGTERVLFGSLAWNFQPPSHLPLVCHCSTVLTTLLLLLPLLLTLSLLNFLLPRQTNTETQLVVSASECECECSGKFDLYNPRASSAWKRFLLRLLPSRWTL